MTTYPIRPLLVAALLATALFASVPCARAARHVEESQASYVLGPNDQISIRALDAEEISDKTYRVGSDGDLTVPMIGRLKAAGLTAGQLESEIASRLEKYIRHPKVAVTVTEFHSQPVSVIGAV